MLNAVNQGRLSLNRLVELMSENPARIFRLKSKGKLEKGYDADLTVVDMDMEKVVKKEDMHYKCGWTVYEGMKLKGWPVTTIINGNVVYDNGRFNEKHKGREVEYDV